VNVNYLLLVGLAIAVLLLFGFGCSTKLTNNDIIAACEEPVNFEKCFEMLK